MKLGERRGCLRGEYRDGGCREVCAASWPGESWYGMVVQKSCTPATNKPNIGKSYTTARNGGDAFEGGEPLSCQHREHDGDFIGNEGSRKGTLGGSNDTSTGML